MSNKIFVGTSLDGYIADRDGGLEFLETVPNPGGKDLGFVPFMNSIDAILMGRKTLEVVLAFDVPWPYSKPVFILSSTMKTTPQQLTNRVEIISGEIKEVVRDLHIRGFKDIYIDGGKLIQSFLTEDMVDEMIVTQIPILLGGGTLLFGALPSHMRFELIKSQVLLQALVQSHYRRIR
ncbi:dihydrofolate reductase family protein [Salidesulfovibrio onnuriiensis]|uniref:dihydrofolate reductase family protein n=1 Tax=Salidesulfovibrio onnuriiensis TaxID=2583823 RepID=UPI0011C86C0C|nr:dihydrofolate reductase family protein [Salidesulfovibrio onnuriiensis]